ncbi:nuclease-related domain-containing protein [Nocardioides sp. MH1]|uniref:nuclease-related domain-containing protein n=1 Tax=Nocardioides sp. MH1 TaxID=3242490 RepID=UPI00351FB027
MAGESADGAARRMREKAQRLQHAAAKWERGAEGEGRTATALQGLPADEWTTYHDVRWPGRQQANLDHVVVGPSGVYVIDSKNWTGTVAVVAGVLRQNGHRREREALAVADAATAVARLVPWVRPEDVQPVLCFVGAPVVGDVYAHGVTLCNVDALAERLAMRPHVLDAPTREEVARQLGQRLYDAPAAPRSSAPGLPPRSRPRQSHRRTAGPAVLPRLVGVAVAVTVLGATFTHPELCTKLGEAVVKMVVSDQEPAKKEPAEKPVRHRPDRPGPEGRQSR